MESLFAILFEVLLMQIPEEIHHFAGWDGGSRGTKIVNLACSVQVLLFRNSVVTCEAKRNSKMLHVRISRVQAKGVVLCEKACLPSKRLL